MIYFATASGGPSGEATREAMRAGHLGLIETPASKQVFLAGVRWCADNAVFAGKYPGDDAYLQWLADRIEHAGVCSFVVAPDVVGDATATLARSAPMLPRIRALGYRVALVAQDGLEHLTVPWDDFDVLFLGGTTGWKLSGAAKRLAAEARERGKWVHMGRVNSEARLRYAVAIGCDSADGTYLAHGVDTNLPKLLGWLQRTPHAWTRPRRRRVPVADTQAPLWGATTDA